MATLICNNSGNLTGAATFAAAEVGAGAINLIRNQLNTFAAATSVTTGATITVTSAKVIDGAVLWFKQSAVGSTGTLKVDLQKGGVSQASVTINKTDLPDSTNVNPIPVFFKFTGTATGDGVGNWNLTLTTTGTGTLTYYSASASNQAFTRALRTTTAATPAAADDLYIVGELTGAGTNTPRIVTMDSTAATAYGNGALNSTTVAGGGIHVSNYGTLSYGTTASTNYVLRVNGDLIVYQFGTLNVGSSTVSSVVTLDGATSNVTLSGGNLTATHSNTTTDSGARSTAVKTTGKYYFEARLNTTPSNGDAVGVLQNAATFNNLITSGINCSCVFGTGLVYSNDGATGVNVGAFVAGDVASVAVDFDNARIWFRKNAGDWNQIGGNPTTNVSGLTLETSGVGYVPCVGFTTGGSGNNVTLNFGATAYAYAVPSGYSNWGTSGGEIPRTSTAVLEFQQLSADGDFGLRCLDNAVVNIAGLSRTSGKNIVKCKLTADVASASMNMGPWNNAASAGAGVASLEASGNSLTAINFLDNASNTTHYLYWQASATVTNTTLTASVWLARGSGTNNRYVRVYVSGNTVSTSNSFFSETDLQAGTAGTATAVGTATATGVSITPCGRGYVVRLTGKVGSGAITPSIWLLTCSAPGTTSYAGNSTECFICDHIALVQTASISDTTFNVDTDTGWLSGDAVCIASTTRTATDCEIYPLNANAGASSFISLLYPFGSNPGGVANFSTHHGTTPTQAEIGLITRNVKIRSTSTTLMSYVYCTALSTVTASWAEFYYVGASSVNKRGIEMDGGAVANAKNFTYCSIHDMDNYGFYCNANGVTSLNVTFSNNVVWNNLTQNGVTIAGTNGITNTDWVFDSNLLMRTTGNGFVLQDVGGVCTNNIVVGCGGGSYGFYLNENTGLVPVLLGTFSSNVAHSSANYGLGIINTDGLTGVIDGFTGWRNSNSGIFFNTVGNTSDLIFNNLVLFGNPSGINETTGRSLNITGTSIICGDSTFACATGVSCTAGDLVAMKFSGVNMAGGSGIYVPNTSYDVNFNTATVMADTKSVFNNCKFGATNLYSPKTYWTRGSYLSFEKYNQTAGDHRTEMTFGQLRTDATVFKTAAPSMKMTPNSASNKLESAPSSRGMLVAVNSGSTVTASAYVRKDTTYTGNQPRLIVRANPAVGITADTVLATYSTGTGTWNQLSGTTIAVTDAGAMEFIIDCDGTAGFINVDDWTASTT